MHPSRQRSDSLARRLREWITPSQPMATLPVATPVLCSDFRLYVLKIDRSTSALLDPQQCQYSFGRLSERLFPNLQLRLAAEDIDDVQGDGAQLLLTPLASTHWLLAEQRPPQQAGFGFMYAPFVIANGDKCLLSGRIQPAVSQAQLPVPTLVPSAGARRISLRLNPVRAAALQNAQSNYEPRRVIGSMRLGGAGSGG